MDFVTKVKALVTMMQQSAKAQTILASTLGVLALGGLGIGGFSAYEHYYGPEAMVSAEVNTESTQTQTEEIIAAVTETEFVEETEETETETELGPVLVKLVGSSIEKDLKIKIQDEEKKNIKGEDFYITVTPDEKNAKTSTYNDHDNDGIIYIKNIDGGDYIVALSEIEGYYTEEESIKVTVKETIEYVKVEVEDEIKTEDEVDPSEDAETKEEVEVEAEIVDTVPWLDSTVTATEVPASSIDKTPYQSAVASVGANCDPVTVPTATTAMASFQYKNLFLVGTGTNGDILPVTENESVGSTETDNSENTGDSETPDSETPDSETPDSETPDSETPDSENGGTTTTVTATVAMPKTAKMFVSTRSAANTVELTVSVNDTNETKIVDEAGIKWSVKNDTTGNGTTGTGVTITGSGKTVKVSTANSKKAGTATVVATISYTVNGTTNTVVLECAVTVSEDTYDSTIALEDSAGDILYTDKNCTTIATVADLMENNVSTFYKNPRYTGWQAIGGKLYYYDANGNPVTGEQTISGIKYTFGSDGALSQGTTATGIDVSRWQGNIDWPTVKAAGIEFVIIRVGYRGSETGVLVEDSYYRQNIKGATEAGLKVGVYFFTQAITKAEAVEEASMVLSLTSGYNLSYPIFIDTENGSGNARANGLDKATRTECIVAFCETIRNAGKRAGVYASKSWFTNKLDTSRLDNYYIWVAQYNTECTYTGRYNIWQYTETGSVPGIKGNVDLNISYMN